MTDNPKPVSVGFIGFGKFSRFLLSSLTSLPTVQVRSVYDPNLRSRPHELSQDAHIATSLEELLTDPTIEAVHIVTPPSTHADIARAAIAAGKHVVVEKPIALNPQTASKIIAAAQAGKKVLAVNYVLRYNPLLQTIHAIIKKNLFGKLLWLRLENAAPGPPIGHWFWDLEQSGGIHLEHGVHFFDAALWLLDQIPKNITGELIFRQHKNTEAFATAVFPDQSIARFAHGFITANKYVQSTTWLLVWERARLVVNGWIPRQAELIAAATPDEITILKNLEFTVSNDKNLETIHATRVIAEDEQQPYAEGVRRLWSDVATAIRKNQAGIFPPGADPAASVALAWSASRRHINLP